MDFDAILKFFQDIVDFIMGILEKVGVIAGDAE